MGEHFLKQHLLYYHCVWSYFEDQSMHCHFLTIWLKIWMSKWVSTLLTFLECSRSSLALFNYFCNSFPEHLVLICKWNKLQKHLWPQEFTLTWTILTCVCFLCWGHIWKRQEIKCILNRACNVAYTALSLTAKQSNNVFFRIYSIKTTFCFVIQYIMYEWLFWVNGLIFCICTQYSPIFSIKF